MSNSTSLAALRTAISNNASAPGSTTALPTPSNNTVVTPSPLPTGSSGTGSTGSNTGDPIGGLLQGLAAQQAQDRLTGAGGVKDADTLGDQATEKDLYTYFRSWTGQHPDKTSVDFNNFEANATGMSADDIARMVSDFQSSQMGSGGTTLSGVSISTGGDTTGSTMGNDYQSAASNMPGSSDIAKLGDPSFNPPIPTGSDYSGDTYSSYSNINLYPSGSPSPADVEQHGIGDCYIDASLASLAAAQPDYIKNMISQDPNKPGTYDVKMYDPTGKPITVTVDSNLLTGSGGSLVGISGQGGKPTWASIVEKASAKYNTIYGTAATDKSNNYGGLAGWAAILPSLVGPGEQPKGYPAGSATADQAEQVINSTISSGGTIVGGFSGLSDSSPTYFDGLEAEKGHAYSVLGVVDHDGGKCVEMRNPWGTNTNSSTSNYDNTTDGVIYVPIDQFVKDCDFAPQATGATKSGSANPSGWTPPPPATSSSASSVSTPSASMPSGVSSSDQQSLIDAFNSAAGAAGESSFTTNINDGWSHIKADMSANNTAHLQTDLQWMLDHISNPGSYNSHEKPVVDAINKIASAYGLTLTQPQAMSTYVPMMF